jgi:glucose/arabinose dehydrogenase
MHLLLFGHTPLDSSEYNAAASSACLRKELSMRVHNGLAATVGILISIIAMAWGLAAPRLATSPAVFMPLIRRPGTALPPADEASARLTVPAGFAVRIYASGLGGPRLMTVGPDGQLYVAERGSGRVTRLPDANDDGLADANQVVADGLNGPHNLEWHAGSLYVAENDKVTRLTDNNADGDFLDAGEKTTLIPNLPTGGNHTSRTLHFGPDGKLYVAAGSTCNACVETDKRRATIMRFNPDGSLPADNPFASDLNSSRRPVWAEGLRNSVDFLFMPDGQLWADHNGSDNVGSTPEEVTNHPPEEVVIGVEKGKHYGWPFCYTPTQGATPAGTKEVPDTDNNVGFAPPISSCDQVVPALYTDLAHQAPLGMVRYDKTQFPAAYQGNLFIAYHGSWNASAAPRDCKVQMISVVGGKPVSGQAFLTGFRDNPSQECGNAWGRPAGVAVGARGELFVSDDQNGNVYRVVYLGP